MLAVDARDDLLGEDLRLDRVLAGDVERIEDGAGGRANRGGRERVHLEVAELALNEEDAGVDAVVLERDVSQCLDIEAWCDLDDLRGHASARQASLDPRAEITHRLRLQLVEVDAGAELDGGCIAHWRVSSLSSSRMTLRISSRSGSVSDGAGTVSLATETAEFVASRTHGSRPVKSSKGTEASAL